MTTRKSSAAGAADNIQDAFAKPLKDMAERMQNLNLTGAAGAVIENGRKDLEALLKANEKSCQGLQAVVQRQTEMMRDSIAHWQSAMQQAAPGKDMGAQLAKLDEVGKASFQQALNDIRELAELAARSQAEAFEIVRQRISDNVEQASQLLRPPGK